MPEVLAKKRGENPAIDWEKIESRISKLWTLCRKSIWSTNKHVRSMYGVLKN